MKNRKLRNQIVSAVMAVIITAGLGTAALASAEPRGAGGEPPQAMTQNAQDQRLQPPGGDRAAAQAPVSGGENTAPSAEPPALPGGQQTQDSQTPPEDTRPDNAQDPGASQEPGSAQDPGASQQPGNAQNPGASQQPGNAQNPGASQQPGDAQNPGASQQPGNAQNPGASQQPGSAQNPGTSQEPGENQNPGASQEPGSAQRPDSSQQPVENQQQERRTIRSLLQDLISKLQELLRIGDREQERAQVSPAFTQPQSGSLPGGEQQNAAPAQPGQNSDAAAQPGQNSDATTQPGQTSDAATQPGQTSGSNAQPSGEMPGGRASGEMGGSSGEPAAYAAANTLTEDSDGASYASRNGDENAVLVSGQTVTLAGATVSKTGSTSGENADFYGVNAGVLAKDGATLTLTGAEITTDGTHANGVFSYGTGTTVNISDSVITTSADNSGGIMTTGGATLNAENLTVSTEGRSSAAIRSDRGGGTVNVTDGSYSSAGAGSPAIYSTADITVTGATLTAATSEAVVIEGGNSVTLTDSTVSGSNTVLNGQSTKNTNVLIYQSMSGDAAEGSSSFTMTGGSMTAGAGSMFHVTNVTTEITLSGVDFTYAADSAVFLDASADAWGSSGRNGGVVTLNLDGQDITGAITQDSVSSVTVNMTNGSTWTLTGDSYVTALTGDADGIDLNGYTLYVNGTAWSK